MMMKQQHPLFPVLEDWRRMVVPVPECQTLVHPLVVTTLPAPFCRVFTCWTIHDWTRLNPTTTSPVWTVARFASELKIEARRGPSSFQSNCNLSRKLTDQQDDLKQEKAKKARNTATCVQKPPGVWGFCRLSFNAGCNATGWSESETFRTHKCTGK
jgi:hypothetical protein